MLEAILFYTLFGSVILFVGYRSKQRLDAIRNRERDQAPKFHPAFKLSPLQRGGASVCPKRAKAAVLQENITNAELDILTSNYGADRANAVKKLNHLREELHQQIALIRNSAGRPLPAPN